MSARTTSYCLLFGATLLVSAIGGTIFFFILVLCYLHSVCTQVAQQCGLALQALPQLFQFLFMLIGGTVAWMMTPFIPFLQALAAARQ